MGSLCATWPSLFFMNIARNSLDVQPQVLIISPLLSIMKEQTDLLASKGFTATFIGKDKSEDASILDGKYQFVFSSPEAILQNDKWRDMLSGSKSFRLFVVDCSLVSI